MAIKRCQAIRLCMQQYLYLFAFRFLYVTIVTSYYSLFKNISLLFRRLGQPLLAYYFITHLLSAHYLSGRASINSVDQLWDRINSRPLLWCIRGCSNSYSPNVQWNVLCKIMNNLRTTLVSMQMADLMTSVAIGFSSSTWSLAIRAYRKTAVAQFAHYEVYVNCL